MLQAFLRDDSGATSIEYGLVAGLVSIAILASVISLGDSVNQAFAQVNDDMEVAAGIPAAETPDNNVVLEPVLEPVAIEPVVFAIQ